MSQAVTRVFEPDGLFGLAERGQCLIGWKGPGIDRLLVNALISAGVVSPTKRPEPPSPSEGVERAGGLDVPRDPLNAREAPA
jgi:hypothetical protein